MKNLFANPSAQMRYAVCAAIALVGISTAYPAMADPHGHGRPVVVRHDDWGRHARMAHDWHRHDRPGVVYAPPAIIEAPPPQPAGLNLIIPFNIR